MGCFKKIPLDGLLQNGVLSTDEAESPFFLFNQYIDLINTAIATPKSELDVHRKAVKAQNAYNRAFESAKQRWKANEDKDALTFTIPKELAGLQRRFNDLKEDLDKYKSRQAFMLSTIKEKKAPETDYFCWEEIEGYFEDEDKDRPIKDFSRKERIHAIKTAWQQQGNLVIHNLDDIIDLKKEVKDFSAFFDVFVKKIKKDYPSNVIHDVLDAIAENKNQLEEFNERIDAAIKWRLESGLLRSNLKCDDSLYALLKTLVSKVEANPPRYMAEDLHTLFSPYLSPISFSGDFGNLLKAYKRLQKRQDTDWLGYYWTEYSKQNHTIPVGVKAQHAIPSELEEFIPSKPGYTLGGWIRYYYFRTRTIANGFWSGLKKWFLGSYNETLVFINETVKNIQSFERDIKQSKDKGLFLSLEKLDQVCSFKQALDIPFYIQQELQRTQELKPSYTMGVLFRWLPFLGRHTSYQFFSRWQGIVIRAEEQINESCQYVVSTILPSLEHMIVNAIENKKFNFSTALYKDIKSFIGYYGNEQQKALVEIITNPINIIKKINFVNAPDKETGSRSMNQNIMESMMLFSQKYCTSKQSKAVSLLLSIMSKEFLPNTDAKMQFAIRTLTCLFPEGADPDQEYQALMNWVGEEVIFPQGDSGSEDLFEFMQRHAPKVAQNWNARRNEDADDKFLFINYLLNRGSGSEIDLQRVDWYKSGQIQFSYYQYERIINDIKILSKKNKPYLRRLRETLSQYVAQYDGRSAHYANMIMLLTNGEGQDLELYCTKRLQYLIMNNDVNTACIDDFSLFGQLIYKKNSLSFFKNTLDREYHGDNQYLADLILKLDCPEITAVYFAKRLSYIIINGLELSDEEKAFYQALKNNPVFVNNINNHLSAHVNSMLRSDDTHQLCDEQFLSRAQLFSDPYTQDALALVKLTQLLKAKDEQKTLQYMKVMIDLKIPIRKLIQTEEGADSLLKLYEDDHLACLELSEWSGHSQYIYQFFDAPFGFEQNNEDELTIGTMMAQKMRLLWLDNFLMQKGAFASLPFKDNVSHNLHQESLSAPNENMDLERMYGKERFKEVIAIIQKRLYRFDPHLPAQCLTLIKSYVHRSSLLLQGDNPLLRGQLEFYERLSEIMRLFGSNQYDEAIEEFSHLYAEHLGQKQLVDDDVHDWRDDLIDYQSKMLPLFWTELLDYYKSSYVLLHLGNQQIHSTTKLAHLTQTIEKMATAYHDQAIPTQLRAIKDNGLFVVALVRKFNSMQSINEFFPTYADAQILQKYASLKQRDLIANKIKKLRKRLKTHDPLSHAVQAFIDIVHPDNNGKHDKRDQQTLLQYRNANQDHEEQADEYVKKITNKLKAHELFEFGHEVPKRYIKKAILAIKSSKQLKKMAEALDAHIQGLLSKSNPSLTQALANHIDTLGELSKWLQKNPNFKQSNFTFNIFALLNRFVFGSMNRVYELIFAEQTDTLNAFLVKYKTALALKDVQTINYYQEIFHDLEKQLSLMITQDEQADKISSLHEFITNAYEFLGNASKLSFYQDIKYNLLDYRLMKGAINKNKIRTKMIRHNLSDCLNAIEVSIGEYFEREYLFSTDTMAQLQEWIRDVEVKDYDYIGAILSVHSLDKIKQFMHDNDPKKDRWLHQGPDHRDAQKLALYLALKLQFKSLKNLCAKGLNDKECMDLIEKINNNQNALSTLCAVNIKHKLIGDGSFREAVLDSFNKVNEYFSWESNAPAQDKWYRRRDSNSHAVTSTGF